TVEFEFETGANGKVVLKGSLPASLPEGLFRNLRKACEAGLAGIAPGFYRRAVEGTLKTQIQTAVTDQICSDIRDPTNRELLSFLFQNQLSQTASKIERRAQIVDRAVPTIEFETGSSGTKTIISDEFLFHFWEAADKVSHAELQEIFAKILANEIMSPGRFSAATLNMLPTFHPELARKFEKLCKMSFLYRGYSFVILQMQEGADPFKINRVSDTRTFFGLTDEDLLDLRSFGLIRSTGGWNEEFPDLKEFFTTSAVEFAGQRVDFDISAAPHDHPKYDIFTSTRVISLTPSGCELRRVIALEPNPEYKARLIEVMKMAHVTMTIQSG
ncbi:MAG: DUF2806 domain-containing protein, partial [Nitrososphaera sp.]|nr:DUF2806 domain-containing protein [Nitrososphaera sp.]